MSLIKKLVIGAALLLALSLGALVSHSTALLGTGPVPVAHADGCDGGNPPPPGLECPDPPLQTPTPKR